MAFRHTLYFRNADFLLVGVPLVPLSCKPTRRKTFSMQVVDGSLPQVPHDVWRRPCLRPCHVGAPDCGPLCRWMAKHGPSLDRRLEGEHDTRLGSPPPGFMQGAIG